MKYAMIVALALLGACAPDDADPVEETSPEATTSAQAPLDKGSTSTVPVVAAGLTATPATPQLHLQTPQARQSGPAFNPGSLVMSPQSDGLKPQPQPWKPDPEQGDPPRDETRTDTVQTIR